MTLTLTHFQANSKKGIFANYTAIVDLFFGVHFFPHSIRPLFRPSLPSFAGAQFPTNSANGRKNAFPPFAGADNTRRFRIYSFQINSSDNDVHFWRFKKQKFTSSLIHSTGVYRVLSKNAKQPISTTDFRAALLSKKFPDFQFLKNGHKYRKLNLVECVALEKSGKGRQKFYKMPNYCSKNRTTHSTEMGSE